MIGRTSQKKRLLSLLLSFVMIMTMLSSTPLTAFAAASDTIIEKADPAYTVPTGLTASYGQTLADVALPKADNGTWSWVKAETTKVGLPGNRTFKAVFTPNDTVNYNTVTVDVTITVSQTVLTDVRKPVVTAPEALAVPQTTLDKGPHYVAVLFWDTDEEVFGFNTAYTASISLTPTPHQGYVFDKDVIESIRTAMEADGWKVYGNEKSLSMSKTFEPTRKADLTITLADQTITYGETIDGSGYSFVCELPDVQVTAGLVPSTQQPTANGQITLAEVVVTDAAGMDITDTLNIQSNTAKLTVNRRPVVFTAQTQTIVYGQTISGSAYTADGLLDGHSAVVNLTPGTGNVTANGTITPSGAVITADSTDVTANYEISYVIGKLVIKPDTSKIDSLTTENVTSANETDIQAVLDMMADSTSPQTGDNTQMWLWRLLLIVSAMGITTIYIEQKKQKAMK